jgi:uncharacterized protein YndB with AHSA1/START domain
MAENRKNLAFERALRVSANEVFQAFTNATLLRMWLCDFATIVPQPGGRFYLWWNSGYYAAGEVVQVVEGKSIQFRYLGRHEPGETLVDIQVTENDDRTCLVLTHGGIKTGKRWEEMARNIQSGWERGLENLISVLETGADLRIIRRPMIGITFAEFDAALASVLNVPVKHGLRVEGTVEGMGARAAGLQKNDVIVEMAGLLVSDHSSLINIIQKYKAGDTVELGIYRGSQLMRISMVLSARPLPEIPASCQALSESLKKNYAQFFEIDPLVAGISEETAGQKPSPNEWSVKETLAHLIISERDTHTFINELVSAQVRHADGYVDNLDARIQAVLHSFPTLPSLLECLHKTIQETEIILSSLPEKFVDKKPLFWYMAYNFLQPNFHIDDHLKQIKDTLAIVKKD